MVRQATATAVNASISTPVGPRQRASAQTTRPGTPSSGVMSTTTLLSCSGWQSGMRSEVFFAAMIPAIRAGYGPFLGVASRDGGQRGGGHADAPLSDGDTARGDLFRNVDHTRFAFCPDMRKTGRATAAIVSRRGRHWRLSFLG